MDFAQITFQGRLTDDPEIKKYGAGQEICKFTVACNRRINKDEEKTAFIPVTVFGKQAAICGEYLSKGREVHVTGEFETDSYTDSKGIQRKGFGCVARDVLFGRGGTRGDEKVEEEKDVGADLSTLDAGVKRQVSDYIKSIPGEKNR